MPGQLTYIKDNLLGEWLLSPVNDFTTYTPNLNLMGDAEGETNGYPTGLVVKIDKTANTCTPLAAAPVNGDVLGILMDNYNEPLAAAAKSPVTLAVAFRDCSIYVPGLKVRPGADASVAAKVLFAQGCAISTK